MPQHSLSSDRILEIIEKLKVKHYESTIFNKVELFIRRICYDDENRLHLLNNKTVWLVIFNKFKEKLIKNGFKFNQRQGGTGSRTVIGKRKDVETPESIRKKKDIINEFLVYILEKTTLFHDDDMNKGVNINKEEYLNTLENDQSIEEKEKKYFLENSDNAHLSEETTINEVREKYINQLVKIYYYKHKIPKESETPITVWNKDYVNKNCFPSLSHFLGYIFHLGDKNNYWEPWNLDIKSLNQKVNIDLNQGLKNFKFIRDEINDDIKFDYVVNYLVIMLCLYNIYYNTRICVHYRNEKSKVNNKDVIIQAVLSTFNYEPTTKDFLAKFFYNIRFDDEIPRCISKKTEIEHGHVELKDYYLKQKIYLGNQYDKEYKNLITKDLPSVSTFNPKFNKPTLTTYNLQEKNNRANNFEDLIDNFINKMYLGSSQKIAVIKNSITNSPVNLYQEVNKIFLENFVKKQKQKLELELEEINIKLDLDLKTKGGLFSNFFVNNNIVKNSGNYTIPCYKFKNRFYVYTTDRLSSFDENNLNKCNLNKCNLICSDKKIEHNNIFIGKLLDSCIIHWTHTFIAIKNNNNIYINIHLDTDKTKYTSQIELMYLLKHVIPEYDFFEISNQNSENQKIYIAGDFNLDCVDIISTINLKVNHIFYKDKIFKIALNNIITHKNGNSLDNCIIIEYRTKHSSSSTPTLGVPKPVKYNPDIFVSKYDNSDELPDHGLVILKDSEINSSLNKDCSDIFEDIYYINKEDVMRTSGGSKKNVGKKNVDKKNVNKKNIDNSKKK